MYPKKDRKEFQSDDESDTYSYEDEYISLEEHKKGEFPDKLIAEGERV